MNDLTMTGIVATTPRNIVTTEGLSITSFRLASTVPRTDHDTGEQIGSDTQWTTVTFFRQLATNVVQSIKKGERVLVTGSLRVREWANEERTGATVDLEAATIGHDLNYGTAEFTRVTDAIKKRGA